MSCGGLHRPKNKKTAAGALIHEAYQARKNIRAYTSERSTTVKEGNNRSTTTRTCTTRSVETQNNKKKEGCLKRQPSSIRGFMNSYSSSGMYFAIRPCMPRPNS